MLVTTTLYSLHQFDHSVRTYIRPTRKRIQQYAIPERGWGFMYHDSVRSRPQLSVSVVNTVGDSMGAKSKTACARLRSPH